MKTILKLLLNDLKRDAKGPWAMLLFVTLPLALSLLIASVFGGSAGTGPAPTLHVALLDQDKDMLTGMLRSLPTQGAAAKRLRLHFVETREEGLRLLEQDQVSALVVLPTNLTVGLLDGRTNSLELYENPAQQILPRIVREGVSLLALGLSGAAEVLGEPLRQARRIMQKDEFPAEGAVSSVAADSVRTLGNLRSYLFPPLIKFETVAAADFKPLLTNQPAMVTP
ncbi:MAG TPA: hypothetical protein VG167_20355 [Verrucomicrobiae bacterium]|nr:hypothetical protein [Verrucomicrobiae bacterium]